MSSFHSPVNLKTLLSFTFYPFLENVKEKKWKLTGNLKTSIPLQSNDSFKVPRQAYSSLTNYIKMFPVKISKML